MHLQTNIVFDHLTGSDKTITIEQGGTRSGKTYNILLYWLFRLRKEVNQGKVLSIVRKTLPALKMTALRDFIEILKIHNIYNEKNHNKTDNIFYLFGNTVEFFSLDDEQKVRGRKRDYLFLNEANEMRYEEWQQLIFRTSGKIVIDYNPSMSAEHWILTSVKTRDDADFFITTYRDNPFLNIQIVKEIERLKDTNPNLWKIYGLGIPGIIDGLIFPDWDPISHIPENYKLISYGLDFGFTNDPTACVAIYKHDNNLILDELIYRTGLLNSDIIKLLKQETTTYKDIYADCAEPKSIEEIHRAGINIKPCSKGKDSVTFGINLLLQHKLFVTQRSINLMKELRNYTYIKDKDGKPLNEPCDLWNHAIDAARYGITATQKPNIIKQYYINI